MSRISGKCMKFSICIIHSPKISSTLFPAKRVLEPRHEILFDLKFEIKLMLLIAMDLINPSPKVKISQSKPEPRDLTQA